jgi:hypothetical protein
MNGERYNIATLADMAAIPESARSRFLAELPRLLSTVAEIGGIATLKECDWIDDDKDLTTVRLETDGRLFAEYVIKTGGAS